MPFERAGQLARATPTARPEDALGIVAENLRASNYDAIPVLDRAFIDPEKRDSAPPAHILGVVDERDLARAVLPVLARREAVLQAAGGDAVSAVDPLLESPNGVNGVGHLNGSNGYHGAALDAEPADVADLTARDVMRHDFGIVPAMFSLHNALLTLERYDSSALPVVDPMGGYRGMISRADIIAALGEQVRPPVVGGMATPLGVWLTTGTLSAGVPPVALFLSGMVMAFCLCVAHIVLLLALSFISPEAAAMFHSGRLGATSVNGSFLNFAVTGVEYLLFLLVLRSLPMSGIHAAEHQTVWAIERGLPLTPEYVSQMPRAHPRCGTNLVALGGLIEIIFRHLPSTDPTSVLMALLFVYLAWRRVGTFLQEYFTTRPATPKQLQSGIKAGRELMALYQAQPHVLTSFGARMLNSGIIGASLGMMLVLSVFNYLEQYLAALVLR